MTRSLYLLGAPGSGKSTVMETIVARLGLEWAPDEKVRRELWVNPLLGADGSRLGLAWGKRRPEYSGTDALSQSVLPQALTYIRENPLPEHVLGEGMRLSTPLFLVELAALAPLTVVYLDAEPGVLEQRRSRRAGKPLSPTFVKQATTRARNAADAMAALGFPVARFDTCELNPWEIAEEVCRNHYRSS